MKVLELFCGTKSIGKVFEKRGHEVITLDFDDYHNPDICKSILDFDIKKDLPKGWKPDIIWASPPCQCFSVAAIGKNWEIGGIPKNSKTALAIAYVLKTLEIINLLNPTYWFIENPRGMLRKLPFMQKFHRNTLSYCQYGDNRMKPTDIWTNHLKWIPKPLCKNGDDCHISAPRGSQTGTQGLKNSLERGKIPEELCEEIADICEGKLKEHQKSLEAFGQ